MNRITLKDIAERAGVAPITVSYVLHNKGRISEETRKRVMAIADKLGYRRNASAMMMRTGRYSTIAFITAARNRFQPVPLIYSASQYLMAKDYNLALTVLNDLADLKDKAPRILREQCMDGMLAHFAQNIAQDLMDLVSHYRIPVTWVNTKAAINCVYPDEEQGGRIAAEYLVAMGHRRIALLYNDKNDQGRDNHFSLPDRIAGYSQVLTNANIPQDLVPCTCGSRPVTDPEVVKRRLSIIRKLLQRRDRPTAVIAMGPELAEPTLVVAKELRIDIPRDLSLLTFGISKACTTGTFISTLSQPFAEIGIAAAKQLLLRIEEQKQQPGIAIPYGNIDGETCVPPTR